MQNMNLNDANDVNDVEDEEHEVEVQLAKVASADPLPLRHGKNEVQWQSSAAVEQDCRSQLEAVRAKRLRKTSRVVNDTDSGMCTGC